MSEIEEAAEPAVELAVTEPEPPASEPVTEPEPLEPAPAVIKLNPQFEIDEPKSKSKVKGAAFVADVEKTEAEVAAYDPTGVVFGNGEKDDIRLDACVYKNLYAKKSLSVHHVQRLLVARGHHEAGGDLDGYYGDGTKYSVAEFQTACGLEASGFINAETLTQLAADDPYTNLVIS